MDWKQIVSTVELEMIDEHRCKNNHDADIAILNCYFSLNSEYKWRIVKVWIAGDEEVLDGEADEIGEIKKLTTILIEYCPFCGEKLLTNKMTR